MDEKSFISFWIKKLSAENISDFPQDFMTETDFETIALPKNRLLLGKEFFGEYELITTEGIEFMRVNSYEKAKYFIYSHRNKSTHILLPNNNNAVKEMVTKYEKYLDSIMKNVDQDFKRKFPNSKNSTEIIRQIFNHLNLIRL
jgi:hypothetical protein